MTDSSKREQWAEFLEEFQAESDRACAVLGAAFLGEQLRSLLTAFLVDDLAQVEGLFEGAAAPLSSFASRTQMAYMLGFLSPSQHRDLDLIRRIRNKFAHDLHGVSFTSPSIASRCAELAGCNVIGNALGDMGPRSRFVVTVAMLSQWIPLRRLGIGDSRRQVQPEAKQANV